MKRISAVSIFLIVLMIFSITSSALASPIETLNQHDITKGKLESVIYEMSSLSKGELDLTWDQEEMIPSFISGTLSKNKVLNNKDILSFLSNQKPLFKIENPEMDLKLIKEVSDELGLSHYKFQQMYHGIPVYGSELIVHTNKSKQVSSVNGKYKPSIYNVNVSTDPTISDSVALNLAKEHLENQLGEEIILNDPFTLKPESNLMIYPFNKQYYLVYYVKLNFVHPEHGYWHVFVDATNGTIIDKYNAISHGATVGSGHGVNNDLKSPLNMYLDPDNYDTMSRK